MTTLSFDIIGRDRGASKVLTDVSKSAGKTADSLKGLKVAAAVGLVAVTAAAVKFGVSSVRAYSEAQTAQVKLQDAFAKFPRLADTNISALRGLNTELAKKTRFDDDATASGQAVLAQFKLTGQQITQLTPLLQDYAAKTGKDLPTAARDLGKAMLGQGRSLKAVGIDFKDTGTAGGNFSQIMGGLRTQVGGFAEKEGKTAAGQAAILKNQFGELQESVGQALLPALLKVGGGLLKVVNAFNGLSDASKTTILSIGGGIVTVGLSALAIGKLAVTVRAARDAFRALGIASKTAVIGIPVLGVALAAAGAVIGVFAGRAAQAKQRTEDIGEALHGMTGEVTRNTAALDQNVRATTAKALQDAGALTAATKLGIGLDTLTDAALGNQTAIAEVHAKLLAAYTDGNSVQVQAAAKLSGSFGSVSKSVGDAIAKEKQYRAAVGGAGVAAGTAGSSVEGAGKKVKTAGEKAADASRKLKDLATSLFKASEGALELSGSEISFEQAVDDATRAAKANGKTLDTNTQKGRDNKTALNNLVTSSQNYIRKLVETGASSKKVTAATADARAEFVRVAQKMGLSKTQADKLATAYFKIPKKVETKTSAPGAVTTKNQIKDVDTAVNNLNNKTVTARVNFTAGGTRVILKKGTLGGGITLGGPPAGYPLSASIGGPGPEQGGPNTAVKVRTVSEPRPPISAITGRIMSAGINRITSAAPKYIDQPAPSPGSPGGKVGTVSRGMAATIAAMRRAGGRSFTTYPGHHPSMAKARDVTPPSWKIANVARASSSVWYVIYRMMIASKNHGNGWRPYHPISNRGDFRHMRHVHVGWYDRGGLMQPGGMAANASGRPERVLSPGQTKSFDNLVKVLDRRGGGAVTYNITLNAPNYIGSRSELKQTLVEMARRNELAVITR